LSDRPVGEGVDRSTALMQNATAPPGEIPSRRAGL